VIYLDTHVAAALYQPELKAFSAAALSALEQEGDLRISPIVLLELESLHEIKRTRVPAARIVAVLATEIGLKVCDLAFSGIVQQALEERWTRDPFDRLILAHARVNDGVLITRDQTIRRRYSRAIG
jgi:PIN domain nuclease of toxin-antitoxin system